MKQELGNQIRQARKATGLTQLDLCALLNISEPTLSLIEQGKGNAGINTYEKILNYLKTKTTKS